MLTYLLPTHNRPQRLKQTLEAIAALDEAAHRPIGGGEVIVIDNASDIPVPAPRKLPNGCAVRVIRLPSNIGAAARNRGAKAARGEWIIMLDDDSYPLDSNHVDVLLEADEDIAAIGAEITLPNGEHEAGGLPEVIIGCGAAIRRQAFLDCGGYDPDFDYYAEEYDLCARLLLHGWRIVHDRRFRVRHEKTVKGRDMDRILHRLVRNNGWVMQRYAPANCRGAELAEIVARYAAIAVKEQAAWGFAQGMSQLLATLEAQPRREMPQHLFDRFTGLAQARCALTETIEPGASVAIIEEGKNAWAIRQALHEMNVTITADEAHADALVIGTLSPGPMLDAWVRRRPARSNGNKPIILPWQSPQFHTNWSEAGEIFFNSCCPGHCAAPQ